MLLKPLRMNSWPTNDHHLWIRGWISLIFVEKTIDSLNARAGADSRASSETARRVSFKLLLANLGVRNVANE